ncbi:MAG TPA: sensor histidine kinase [Acidimicrobiales bacterium]
MRTEPMPGATPRAPSWLLLAGLAALAAFQVMGTIGASSGQPDAQDLDALAVVLLVIGPLSLAALWRRPVAAAAVAITVAVVYVGAGYPYGPFVLTPLVALIRCTYTGHRRAAIAIGATGVVASLVAHVVSPRDEGVGWDQVTGVTTWVAIVLVVGEILRARHERRAQAMMAADELAKRRASEERLRIAQELHDVLAHNISLINVQAGVGLHLMDTRPEQARTALESIKGASKEALEELRSALELLRTGERAPRAPTGGLAELDALVARVRSPHLDVDIERIGEPVPVPPGVDLAAYRIAQEALTNVVRHAHTATRAVVRLTYEPDALTVQVDNDGRVPAGRVRTAPSDVGSGGSGIPGMRERAVALGGEFEAHPRASGGFRVRARLPLTPASNGAAP